MHYILISEWHPFFRKYEQIGALFQHLFHFTQPADGKESGALKNALNDYLSTNNFENKKTPPGYISKTVLDYMIKDKRKKV